MRPAVDISSIVVERFGQTMREKLATGEVPFRKAYLGSIVDRVEVDDREIRIVGRKAVSKTRLGSSMFTTTACGSYSTIRARPCWAFPASSLTTAIARAC